MSANEDDLEGRTLPVRYAARPKKLLDVAQPYWVGSRGQWRGATVAKRLEKRLRAVSPLARELFAKVDPDRAGEGLLSQAVVGVQSVLCGTPIGLLSYDRVSEALPGEFDLLVVDEVSKMTLPEFLAVAVKARRWVLVGDPQQLPPYLDSDENGVTLDDVLAPCLELVCSVAASLERVPWRHRRERRMLVVAADPDLVEQALRMHVRETGLEDLPELSVWGRNERPGVLVCAPEDLNEAATYLSPVRGRDRTHNPDQRGTVEVLVERGLAIPRPEFASGTRLMETRDRAPGRIFSTCFDAFHTGPWQEPANQRLRLADQRYGLCHYLPASAVLGHLEAGARPEVVDEIARRYAINALSVYDWLVGIPSTDLDVEPLSCLADVLRGQERLRDAVRPYVQTLRMQYRMHPSLSLVPRALFYFGLALHDGRTGEGCRVMLEQVTSRGIDSRHNHEEAEAICATLRNLDAAARTTGESILVITPYKDQERLLEEQIEQLRRGSLAHLDVEVCTFDRCQGREADYVLISLVRSRATPFLDSPKRWNVGLTRAKEGLFLFGDIQAYRQEASRARRDAHRGDGRPRMSLVARIVEAYAEQLAEIERAPRGVHHVR